MISIATDGERKMTGRVQGVATRFEEVCKPGFFRIWCGLHQLDLKLQLFYKNLMNEIFYALLTGLIAYLRRQQNLISEMNTKARMVADTRWEPMSKVSYWFKINRVRVLSYLEEKKPPCSPPKEWWIVILFIDSISSAASTTFRSLEGLTCMVVQQRQGLIKLKNYLINLVKASTLKIGDIPNDDEQCATSGLFSITFDNMQSALEDLGTFASDTMSSFGTEGMRPIYKSLSECTLKLIEGIDSVVAERSSVNDAAEENLPPVLPHELVKLRGSQFSNIIRQQKDRLKTRLSEIEIDRLEQEFQEMCLAYQSEDSLKNVLDQCDHKASFRQAWDFVKGRFNRLETFCGGLATVFPGTSTVESDFSIVKWEKDDCRSGLTDFSLEGIMHAKQHERMKKLNIV